jgi:hypothetical protein
MSTTIYVKIFKFEKILLIENWWRLTFKNHASYIWDGRTTTLLIASYIFLSNK